MTHRTPGVGMTSPRARARMIARLRELGIRNERVLSAIDAIPRHIFVEEALSSRAYEDMALPLGFSQTISQPYIVARMLEILLEDRALGKTLEIGAGGGYQAAVLAQLTNDVFAVERIDGLLTKARQNLEAIREFRVRLKYADGRWGVPEAAPFDSIIVAAAAKTVPPRLKQQLGVGGKMLLPLESESGKEQYLLLIERRAEVHYTETRLERVRFVPLLSGVE